MFFIVYFANLNNYSNFDLLIQLVIYADRSILWCYRNISKDQSNVKISDANLKTDNFGNFTPVLQLTEN